MKLRFHSDHSIFYDQCGNLYPEPKETLNELEAKLNEACEKLKSLPDEDDIFFDLGMARFNLCSYIENLEWKVDLKLLYAIKNR